MIIGVLLSISFLPVFAWLPLSVVVITLWVTRYKRAMRQLSRPRFWISFVFITLLAALAITYLSGNENALEHGLMTGLEMNVRAAIVILGFSVLGKELYNPSIRRRMQNSNFRNLNEAVELAFESLPKVLSHLPDAWTFFSQPGAVVRSLISLVDERVTELKKERKCPVFIVSGQIADGKTTFLRELAAELTNRNVRVGGFIAERQMNEDVTIGYDLIGIARGERIPFLRMNENGNRENQSHYIQLEGAQEEGQKLLSGKSITHSQVILIDEIGRFEIRGGGWSASLGKLLEDEHACLVIAVRTDMVKDVVECFNINSYFQINVNESGVSAATDRIIGELRI
jgi:nucleoside-triphosphatase